jgi:hypothetical protein
MNARFRQLIQSLILFVRILATDKRFLMKLLGGKHAGIWLMGKNHKHYWRHSQYVTNEDLYPNIYAIFTVLMTMPVFSASSERSFSALRRAKKNCLRATMGDERLSNLSLFHRARHFYTASQ